MNRWCSMLGVGAVLLLAPCATAEGAVSHGIWNELLQRHVKDGRVDYHGLQAERLIFEGYLANLAEIPPASVGGREEQVAFWINAYNACAVKGVLEHQPLSSVKSAKGFFDNIRYRVGGRDLTLHDMETQARSFGDWRVLFALARASVGGPSLRDEAYDAERLNEQLIAQTAEFLQDGQHALRVEGGVLQVSRIFEWYTTDFVPAGRLDPQRKLTPPLLLAVIGSYLETAHRQMIGLRDPQSVQFLDYDWSLNDVR